MAGIMLDPTGKRQKWGAKRKFELKRRTGRQNYLFRVRCGQNPPDLAKIELYAFSGIPDFAPPTLRGLNSPTLRGLMTADFARNGICAIARLVEFAQIKRFWVKCGQDDMIPFWTPIKFGPSGWPQRTVLYDEDKSNEKPGRETPGIRETLKVSNAQPLRNHRSLSASAQMSGSAWVDNQPDGVLAYIGSASYPTCASMLHFPQHGGTLEFKQADWTQEFCSASNTAFAIYLFIPLDLANTTITHPKRPLKRARDSSGTFISNKKAKVVLFEPGDSEIEIDGIDHTSDSDYDAATSLLMSFWLSQNHPPGLSLPLWTLSFKCSLPGQFRIQMKIRSKAAEAISGANRETLFIKNIITKSLCVSIGPLEYCGVGHIIIYIGAASYVAVCKGDPAIPKLHEMRTLQKENKQLNKKLLKIEIGYQRAGTYQEVVVEDQPTKPKKRRSSADQKLALDTLN
ncbi:hypothetical protein B0H11DRAFT_2186167 [Mycena galericulata]|nr:hypothetical protein B0H11DRAFT_2186167 [Mycena galericulata]